MTRLPRGVVYATGPASPGKMTPPHDEKSSGDQKPRRKIVFGGEPTVVRRKSDGDKPSGSKDQNVVLKSAALLWRSERLPLPRSGLVLGPEEQGAWPPQKDRDEGSALVEQTSDGHVLLVTGGDVDVYLNGELLVFGERRPLGQGDAIAVGGSLFHYLPPERSQSKLPRVAPVSAGRIRSHKGELVIGRSEECDLTLDYPTVSRRHAVIRVDSDGATIEDCSSATGLRLNGEVIKRSRIETGDEIAIGPYRILFDGEELVERAIADGLPLQALAVSVAIDGNQILEATDLNLRAGELVALIGESGAGKTTLLRALAGVSAPSSGQVLCGGEPVRWRLSEIGYVPQFDIVHGQLSVFEALDFAARLRLPPDTAETERHRRVNEVIQQLGLEERAELRVDDLSGGQRKRVAVGIELLHKPGALFLDEPTTGLDPGLERMMMELFRELADGGQTVALVTHATGSMELCDRVIVMGRGGIKRFDGSPDELLDAFGVDTPDDVYAEMATGHYPRATPGRSGSIRDQALQSRRQRPQVRQGFLHQTKVLSERYATLVARDQRGLVSLIIQTVVLGLLTAMIFAGDVFEFPPDATKALTGKAAQLLFLMVTISIWMGSISAAREIVKERSVLARELAIGVRLEAYIASKLIVLIGLVSAQVILFFLIVELLKPIGAGELTILAILLLSSWVAVLLGLVVSAYAKSEDQAAGFIPILLVPQLLFGGAIVTLNEMPSSIQWLAGLVPARWSYDAAGTAADMTQRINYQSLDGSVNSSSAALSEGYGPDFFNLEASEFLLISGVFFVALYFLLAWMIRRNLID